MPKHSAKSKQCTYYTIDKLNTYILNISTKKRFWSRGLVKSRQKNWRESRSRETEVGEKIAVTSKDPLCIHKQICSKGSVLYFNG